MRIANSLNVGVGRGRESELVPRLAAAGFEGLDLNYYNLCKRPEWKDPARAGAELDALERAAADAGVAWVQVHGPFVEAAADLSNDGEMLESCRRAVAVCGRLGAPWLVLHPFRFGDANDRAQRERVLAANVEFFRKLLADCEASDVGLAIENVFDPEAPRARIFGSGPEDLCELVDTLLVSPDALNDRADRHLVGVCWDTGHAHILELDQRAALSTLGKRVKALHVHDNDGRDDFHVLPFTTAHMGIDWGAVTAGLADAGYQGAFTLEVSTALLGMPEELFDETLALSASIARCLADRVMESRPANFGELS